MSNINSASKLFKVLREKEKSLGVRENYGSEFSQSGECTRIGALLIHGFGSSPTEMNDLKEFLFNKGINVLSIRLDGHATTVENFSNSGKDSWLASVREGYEIISEVCENTFIIGQSLGAGLALIIEPELKPAGVVSFVAPLLIKDKRLFLTTFKIFRLFFPYTYTNSESETEEFIYSKRPTITLAEMYKVSKEILPALPNLKSPIFLAHAEDDETVDVKSVDLIYEKAGSAVKEIYKMNSGGHRLTLSENSNRDALFNKTLQFMESNS
ncbi:MAG: alpha/beta hydrolase [Candidatus Marinimicrobia bacterium]|nr:alpha/beta hydrolase [Candidatus Neomarinimicrobiota bacterium]